MLHLYEHASLRDIRLASLLSEIAGVMREYHLVMPPDLALLFKALITLEALGTRLVPQFRMIERVTPVVERILAERWAPRQAIQRLQGIARESGRAIHAVPRILEMLVRRLGDENFAVRLEMPEVDRFSRHLESSVNRLTIGLVTAALIVGSSILMAFGNADRGAVAWFLGFLGVVLAFANSLWLIAAIRHSRRVP
jgi:ubiquinone biosynthesis protein